MSSFNHLRLITLPFILVIASVSAFSQKIQRFEYFGSEQGLSQNTVYSILCDRTGFIWVGTTNGLNRYDGARFRVFKSLESDGDVSNNNRIKNIWEDNANFIWTETYDGRYQYFNQRDETFGVVPVQSGQTVEPATSFTQYSDSIVFVSGEQSGVYVLQLNSRSGSYKVSNFLPVNAADVTVVSLFTDSYGNLWILTDKGLAQLTKTQILHGEFVPTNYFPNTCFTSAVDEVNGVVFFGTHGEGLLAYSHKTQRFDFEHNDHHLHGHGIELICAMPDGNTVVATDNCHAYFLGETTSDIVEIQYHGSGRDAVEKFYVDKYRQLWITTAHPGATRVDLSKNEKKYYQFIPAELSASVDHERPFFYEDSNNNLWIGTHGGGLLWYNRVLDRFEPYRNDIDDVNSIPSNIVHCVIEDNSGQLWLGTGQYRGGLVKVISENPAVANYVPDQQARTQIDNVVRCLFEDPARNLWVSSKSGIIYIYDELGNKLRTIEKLHCSDGRLVSSVVYGMMLDNDGLLWIATKGAGVFVSTKRLDFQNIERENLTFINYDKNNDSHHLGVNSCLGDDNAYNVAQDGFGNVWVATYGNGLSRIKRNANGVEISVFNKKNSNILSDKVRRVFIDSKGNLWIATTNCVCRIDGTHLNDNELTFEHFVHSDNRNSLSYVDVSYIFEDSRGTIYFATMGGGVTMLHYDDNGEPVYEIIDASNGLSNNTVFSILEDNGGNIWFATENGISRMDTEKQTFETFNSNNGLIFNSFSEATCARLASGKIAFGGYMGYAVLAPMQLKTSPYKSNLVLTDLTVANREQCVEEGSPLKESLLFAERIDLEASQSSIAIGYRALDYLDPDDIHYSYKLEGFEDDWNYVSNSNKASYTNLPPGEYTFMVRHTYRNGNWSDTARELQIVVHAPWWKTTVAFVIYSVLLILAIYFVAGTTWNINRFRHELTVEKKINEVKLQFFTNIAHEIRTPLTLIVSPLDELLKNELPTEINSQLLIIKRNANRILLLVNQLLDFRKVQNKKMYLKVSETDLGLLVSQVADSFKLLAEHKNIAYSIDIQPNMQSIWVDAAEMDTVVYNLLSNAMKFTEAGKKVNVVVSQNENFTYIKVQDEGCGLPTTDPDTLFKRYTILSTNELSGTGIGLSLSYELVKLHEGELLVESVRGEGSTFTVKLHNGRNHFDANPMISFADEPTKQRFAVMPDIAPQGDSSETTDEHQHTVLVVEDNPEILNYLCSALHSDYNIRRAANGQEALVAAREQAPDIIITDLMMPVMNGIDMIHELKSDIATSHILIIALTAKTTTQDKVEAYKTGIDEFIEKPFNIEHVKAVIANLLQKREQLTALLAGLPGASIKAEDQKINLTIMSKDQEFVRELVKFTEENYKQDLSIDQIADHFHMSRTVFYNKVKGLTEQSPLEFVRRIKFKIAEQLLRKGYNVSEVAFEIGYSDVKYFSKQFRTIFGYSPSQIKRGTEPSADNEA